jgi:tetratricopeptide (TPR) repeat protein
LTYQEGFWELAKENKNIFEDASRQLTAQDLFAGNDEFYKMFEGNKGGPYNPFSQSAQIQQPVKAKPASTVRPNTRLSIFAIAIRISIGIIAAMLLVPISLYCVFAMLAPQPHSAQDSPHYEPAIIPSASTSYTEVPEEPVSWKLAQSYYQKKDYAKASATYKKLTEKLSLSDPIQSMWDGYLNLKLALCAYKLKDTSTYDLCFAKALRSSSPATVALSNYYLAIIKNEQKLYADARLKAYKALALLETIDTRYSASLISDCYFLIAQTLTADALMGRQQQLESPVNWQQAIFDEPLEQLDETGIQHILQSSTEILSSVVMGPQIQKLDAYAGNPRYSVKCSQASVGELFAAFTVTAGQDVRWQCSYANFSTKPITVYLSSTTQQKFSEMAAGSVGLLASFEKKQISIIDPTAALSITENEKLIIPEAVSAWQRFILSYRNDKRLAEAHFAIGLLQHAGNHLPAAIIEFQQVANRFMRSDLAPYSLLNAAKIKIDMSDNSGASQYLKELCAQYEDSPVTDKAHLLLAQTSLAAGNYEYAQQIFRKVCNLNISQQYTLAGMLGAARCYFVLKDYASAADWLMRYAVLAGQSPNNIADLRTVYTMLAEANMQLGNLDETCRAYKSALSLTSATDGRFDIIMKLAAAYMRQENLVDALDTLEQIDLSQLSDHQVANVWLLKAQILAAMNLTDKAVELLTGRINVIDNAKIRSEMALELARSQKALNNLADARNVLCQALLHSEPGLLTGQLQCELADTCIKLGDNKQAVIICSQILSSSPPEELKNRARILLGTAQDNLNHYDKAARAFSGSLHLPGAKSL